MYGIPRAIDKKTILEFQNNSQNKSLEFQHPLSAHELKLGFQMVKSKKKISGIPGVIM